MLVCCSLMLYSEASAQSASRIGEYSYDRGVYRRVTDEVINQTINSAASISDSVEGAQNFLNSTSTFGGWRTSNNTSGLASAGLGFQLQGPFVAQSNLVRNNNVPDNPWMGFKLGPLYVDDVYAGAGMLYSDYTGTPIYGRSVNAGIPSDDNWAAMVWAQVRATIYITDRFAFSFTPNVYYLPLKNEVGWGLGAPLIGMGGIVQPNATLNTAFRQPLGESLQFVMMDQFYIFHPQISLMRNSPYYWANLGDNSPMDLAGRYQFGGFGPYEIDASGDSSFSLNDRLADEEQLLLANRASMSLMGRHGSNISSQLFYDRWDYWDHNFDLHQTWQSGGIQIVQDGPSFKPYMRYEFTAADHWQTHYQYGVLGVQKLFSPDLVAYAEGGWLWSSIENQGSTDSWVAMLGARQRLGPYTWHGIDFGRSPIANFRRRYLATYAQYFLNQKLGANSQLTFFAQQADVDVLGGGGELERSIFMSGAFIDVAISPKSHMQLAVSYEDGDIDSMKRSWQMWTYRISYIRNITNSLNASCFYQYQSAASDTSSYDDFGEHLLYMGVVKHF